MRTISILKVNAIVVPVVLAATTAVLVLVKNFADQTALEETVKTARLLVSAGQATFDYTVEQVKPALEAKYEFLVQSVSSYAATETIGHMQRQFENYRYHVAALNPTNKRDAADAWEADAIRRLALPNARDQYTEIRDLKEGRVVFMAVPIRISNEACLACHSVPDAAPKMLIDTYGTDNGFGWKLNEVIAAQVVSVPMSVAQTRADALFHGVMLAVVASSAFIVIAMNGALFIVLRQRSKENSDTPIA
jgi:protein-histidine pros-kinase